MDRREWLTIVYREANRFLERYDPSGNSLDEEKLAELEDKLRDQLQHVLAECDSLEDIIKHSLLKSPPSDIWRDEESWERVLIGVAAECLFHDVRGITLKILRGELERVPSDDIRT
jgi:hypothetical protein